MTFRLIATRLQERLGWSRLRPAETTVLLVLLLATIAMPVSYRAGADAEHPHTIFQGMIDAITGTHHHHDHPAGAEVDGHGAVELSPFVPVAIPLSILETPRLDPPHVDNLKRETDAPQLLGASMPITSLASIQALGLLVAALLAGVARRPLWSQATRLLNHAVAVESPPPRPA